MTDAAQPCPWHLADWQQRVSRQQQPHAWLFSGPAGIGKRQYANALAASLLCSQPVPGPACGQCRNCLLAQAGTHPDWLLLEPEETGKMIKVDAVRQLVDFMAQTAQQGGRKIIVLHPAEAMNHNAANALLKSLEEPTADTYLLLISDQPSQLLPTIRSRCQQVSLPLPDAATALAWLQQAQPELGQEAAEQLLVMSAGAPLRALELDAQGALSWRAEVVAGIKQLLKGEQGASSLAERWKAVPLILLLDWFCDWTLDLLKYRQGVGQLCTNADMDKVLGYMADRVDMLALQEWQDWLLAHRGMLLGKANLNRVLLLESLLLQWKQLVQRR
ncbi:DNA polymerase III subunit delta' [Halopseudomonas salegens]|uniref:DNA polymerase III subunit delta' n=1 Tax=Halopseudomonas salegens TaxID=1434072 RepID=A0A1H2EZX5_9GAMM|nr:DNA polymerase III subunit delta' [Halopseudomonas salegens]SDU00609.1 DNA polymerase III, delta prime subunit [Halopseudomonas salegens]